MNKKEIKTRSCTITTPEADILWAMLEEKRRQAGLDNIEDIVLEIVRTSLGLPPEYNVLELREKEEEKKPEKLARNLRIVK